MAHRILGNRFASRRAPAWHGIGTTFEETLNASHAAQRAGLDFPIEKIPVTVRYEGTLLYTPNLYTIVRGALPQRNMNRFERDDEDTLIRQPVVLGTCGREFEIISNMEIARLLDPLTERYPVETCGALGKGEQTFFCLLAPETSDVAGDTIKNYFTVLDSKIPGARAKVFYSPVRVVCWNTLCQGIQQATISFDIRHTRGAKEEFKFYSSLMAQMAQEQERTLQAFRRMAAAPISRDGEQRVIERVFPLPPTPRRAEQLHRHDFAALAAQGIPGAEQQHQRAKHSHEAWEKSCVRVKEYRATAHKLIQKFYDEHSRHAGTVWGLYNACTEVSDWREGRGDIAASVLFGERAAEKARAYKICVGLVN